MQSMPTESDVLSYNQSIENSVGRGARHVSQASCGCHGYYCSPKNKTLHKYARTRIFRDGDVDKILSL